MQERRWRLIAGVFLQECVLFPSSKTYVKLPKCREKWLDFCSYMW